MYVYSDLLLLNSKEKLIRPSHFFWDGYNNNINNRHIGDATAMYAKLP